MFFLFWWAHCFYFLLQIPSHAICPLMTSICLWLGRRLGLDQSFLHISVHISRSQAAGHFWWPTVLSGKLCWRHCVLEYQHWIFVYVHRSTKHMWKHGMTFEEWVRYTQCPAHNDCSLWCSRTMGQAVTVKPLSTLGRKMMSQRSSDWLAELLSVW